MVITEVQANHIIPGHTMSDLWKPTGNFHYTFMSLLHTLTSIIARSPTAGTGPSPGYPWAVLCLFGLLLNILTFFALPETSVGLLNFLWDQPIFLWNTGTWTCIKTLKASSYGFIMVIRILYANIMKKLMRSGRSSWITINGKCSRLNIPPAEWGRCSIL